MDPKWYQLQTLLASAAIKRCRILAFKVDELLADLIDTIQGKECISAISSGFSAFSSFSSCNKRPARLSVGQHGDQDRKTSQIPVAGRWSSGGEFIRHHFRRLVSETKTLAIFGICQLQTWVDLVSLSNSSENLNLPVYYAYVYLQNTRKFCSLKLLLCSARCKCSRAIIDLLLSLAEGCQHRNRDSIRTCTCTSTRTYRQRHIHVAELFFARAVALILWFLV